MKVKALVLGTDDSSYCIARSYYDAFNDKAICLGSGILPPFRNTKIADVTYKKGFSSHDDLFVSMMNEVGSKYPDTRFIVFCPVEVYLNILDRNLSRLNFDAIPAYPLGEIYKKYFYKSNFYSLLDEMGISYPKTQVIGSENIEELKLEGELFMKPDDFPKLYALDFEAKKKGYRLKDKEEAKSYLREIYKAGYDGKMLVQQYIAGGDGSEYSLNGYRAHDGKTSMVLARNILSDRRDLTIGNHIVQIDADKPQMYEIAEKITEKLNYVGLFNFDFKVDQNTGKTYVFEMNQRQGRTFYYAVMGGVNLIELAVKDLGFGESQELRPTKKFRMMTLSEKTIEKHIKPELLSEFNDSLRVKNSENPDFNPKDNSFERNMRLKKQVKAEEKEIFQ